MIWFILGFFMVIIPSFLSIVAAIRGDYDVSSLFLLISFLCIAFLARRWKRAAQKVIKTVEKWTEENQQ